MIAALRQAIARRRLQAIVNRNRNAPATVEYRRRRAAAVLGNLRKPVSQ